MYIPIYMCVSTTEVSFCRVNMSAAYDFPSFHGHAEAYTSLLMKFPTCSALFPSGRWQLHGFCCRKPARCVCLTKCSATPETCSRRQKAEPHDASFGQSSHLVSSAAVFQEINCANLGMVDPSWKRNAPVCCSAGITSTTCPIPGSGMQ